MSDRAADLYELVRELKVELAWATRIGVVPPPPTGEMSQVLPQGSRVNLGSIPSQRPASTKPNLPVLPIGPRPTLAQVREELGDCTRCKLSRLGRSQIVFGVGNPDADLMFIGEGPGADEDRIGEPFVGKAGQLLTKIIEGMGFQRQEVYIANIVKCRPPNNRDPESDEVESCEPFLQKQIASVQPKMIVTLGKYASQTLLRLETPITRLRGQWKSYNGIPVMPTFHPAYLLRNEAEKRPVWEDMKSVLLALGRPIPSRGGQTRPGTTERGSAGE